MKYKYLIFFLLSKSEKELKASISSHLFTINKLCREYKEVLFVNLYSLKLFTKKNDINEKVFYDFNLGSNVRFLSFSNYLKFINFLKGKKIVGISFGFGTGYTDLLINFIMGIFDIKHIQIQNAGHHQSNLNPAPNIFKKFVFFYLRDRLSRKLTSFLSILGILQKIQIRFVSNSKSIIFRKDNFFTKIRSKYNLFSVKELILINSRSYDTIKENLFNTEKKYIVVLDEQLNEPQYLRFRKKYTDNQISNHYSNFNRYLKRLSEDLHKEVIITLHPYDDYDDKKKIFKDFQVIKYRTREFIYKAYLVIFFESSAITDAVILNKNIFSIKSNILDKNLVDTIDRYAKELNLPYLDLDQPITEKLDEINLKKRGLIKPEKILKENYKNHLEKYICRQNDETPGYRKIIEELNKRYFQNNK